MKSSLPKVRSSGPWSLSSRRAWIEISGLGKWNGYPESLSSRRAWIEMLLSAMVDGFLDVALLTEGVD